MKNRVAGAFALVLLVTMPAAKVAAQGEETGIAGIHQWVKVGRKTCMLDHFHDGSGTGKSRSQAERAAILAWTEFTAFEYGGVWGRYGNAVSKKMNCSQSSAGWNCAVEARPCRPY
jgi:hypothetical protein